MDWNVVLITAKMDSIAGSVGALLPEIWRSWAEPRNHMQASMIFDYQSTKQKNTSPTRCKTTPQADFLPYFFGFAPETRLSVPWRLLKSELRNRILGVLYYPTNQAQKYLTLANADDSPSHPSELHWNLLTTRVLLLI